MKVIQNSQTDLIYYLIQDGFIDGKTASNILPHLKDMSLTQYLVQHHLISGNVLFDFCTEKFQLPSIDLNENDIHLFQQTLIKFEWIERYRILPIKFDDYHLTLGMTDPTDKQLLTKIEFQTGLRIKPVVINEEKFSELIKEFQRKDGLNITLETTIAQLPIETMTDHDNLEENDEPIIALVDRLLEDAIEKHTSDIHIEPFEKYYRIRFRRDGQLYEAASLPIHLALRIVLRLKILSSLNIAEKRLPQDGRIQLQRKSKIDIRINTCPMLYGEKVVLRLLNINKWNLDIDKLGFNFAQKNLFLEKLTQPQGLILVTGPTGSGKTMTLYSALNYLNKIEKNISSVEDPVEIELAGINQVNVNPKIGLNFANILRTFLRQDPDIIMIGEIRDEETAKMAIQAAQTGHLVLSSLHTNSASETFTRLRTMGVSSYQLFHSISLIIAQRLIRKLCIHCKASTSPPEELLNQSDIQDKQFFMPVGCDYCQLGYQGRVAIFELLTPECEEYLSELQLQTHKNKYTSLWENALEKVYAGETSFAEILRVVGK